MWDWVTIMPTRDLNKRRTPSVLVGILPENLTRIFNHGFTTRKDGHGFGLHSGALAAKELGGSLNVRSDGPGQGAAFTLELPCPKPGGTT
jgi:signal transduction histidine kinase